MLRLLLIITMAVFSKAASSQCNQEEALVDKWNKQLQYKVTEFARKKHRAAKRTFLDCLRNPPNTAPKEQVVTLKINTPANTAEAIPSLPLPNIGNVTVSSYVNFKGEKRQAWAQYFIESESCLNNKNDMALFVACAKKRKQSLKEFEALWNIENPKANH
ncbi:hypothetical protein [Paraglaciecola sp. 2405UD69-4]|uniref:hypothetical protein n=1 Tax=Paraglaciecola sp. 2405UD69-4 TaxID=3391836 RepID=UPI0039C9BED0